VVIVVIRRLWLYLNFRLLLPVSADRLLGLAQWLTALRGWVSYLLNADWRSVVHQDAFLHLRTQEALEIIRPNLQILRVSDRYVAQAREEWVAERLIQNTLDGSADFDAAIKERIHAIAPTQGIIYATIHWAESTVASAFLGDLGRPTWVMNSSFVESEAMPPAIRRHYRAKYRAMNQRLTPGRCVPIEQGIRPFMRHLQHGGAVAMTVDIPGSSSSGISEEWFGRTCQITPGMRHLAARTASVIIPYVARWHRDGWQFQFAGRDEPPYEFFEHVIFNEPTAWWAADLLPLALQASASPVNQESRL